MKTVVKILIVANLIVFAFSFLVFSPEVAAAIIYKFLVITLLIAAAALTVSA